MGHLGGISVNSSSSCMATAARLLLSVEIRYNIMFPRLFLLFCKQDKSSTFLKMLTSFQISLDNYLKNESIVWGGNSHFLKVLIYIYIYITWNYKYLCWTAQQKSIWKKPIYIQHRRGRIVYTKITIYWLYCHWFLSFINIWSPHLCCGYPDSSFIEQKIFSLVNLHDIKIIPPNKMQGEENKGCKISFSGARSALWVAIRNCLH